MILVVKSFIGGRAYLYIAEQGCNVVRVSITQTATYYSFSMLNKKGNEFDQRFIQDLFVTGPAQQRMKLCLVNMLREYTATNLGRKR